MTETAAVYDIEPANTDLAGVPAAAMAGVVESGATELIRRDARIAILTEETRGLLHQAVMTHFEIGKRLLEMRELAEEKRWLASLDELGIQPLWAQRHMQVARKIEAMPKLRDLAEQSFHKALALIQSTDDATLEEITAGDVPLLTLERVDGMSVRELKKEIKRLTDDKDQVVQEETQVLQAEIDNLVKERDGLQAEHQSDAKTAHDTARELRATVQTLANQARALSAQIAHLSEHDAMMVKDALESSVSSGSILLKETWQAWMDRSLELGLED